MKSSGLPSGALAATSTTHAATATDDPEPALQTQEFPLRGKRYRRYRFPNSIQQEIRALKSDNVHAILALFEDAFWIIVAIATCQWVSMYFYPLAVLIIGARQRGLSSILHDSAHGVAATNRILNKLLGTLPTAYPIFQRHYAYRASHVLMHHSHLGDPERDPDLCFFMDQRAYVPSSPKRLLLRNFILPALGTRTFGYLKYLIDNRFRFGETRHNSLTPRPTARRASYEAVDGAAFLMFWISTVVVFAYAGLIWKLFLFWGVPYLTAFQTLGWYIELSEHTPLMAKEEVDLFMTRNRKSRGLEKFLTGIHNDHHHLDHHLDTRTPFWLLPQAHEIRLRDAEYARIDRGTGGLFIRGPNGAASALSVVFRHMKEQVHMTSGRFSRDGRADE